MSTRVLLDTHAALWAVTGDRRLTVTAVRRIEQCRGGVWVSAANLWEIAIKRPLKSRRDPMPFSARDAIGHFRDAGFDLLPLRPEHAASMEELPPLHADPFDRLLVAQARFESMPLLTAGDAVVQYGHGIVRI